MEREPTVYPMMGCTLTDACERLGRARNAIGVIAIVWRGDEAETEVGMSFNPGYRIKDLVDGFHRLGGKIIEGQYAVPQDRAVELIAKAVESEYVVLVMIEADGSVRIAHNQPFRLEGKIKRLGVEPHGMAGALLREIASQIQSFN
jgi:hypothetical protein